MTTYRRGDVVLVLFPFTDLTRAKKRPALVISANWYNTDRRDCILLPITSTRHSDLRKDEVLLTGTEITSAGLLHDSVIKVGNVFTIRQDHIDRRLGTLTPHKLGEAFEKLVAALSG